MPKRRKAEKPPDTSIIRYDTAKFVARGSLLYYILWGTILLYYTLDFRLRFIKYEREGG